MLHPNSSLPDFQSTAEVSITDLSPNLNLFDFLGSPAPTSGCPFQCMSPATMQKGLQPVWTSCEKGPLSASPSENDPLEILDNMALDQRTGEMKDQLDNPPEEVPPPAQTSTEPDRLEEPTRQLSDLNLALLKLDQDLNADPWAFMFQMPSTVIAALTSASDPTACLTTQYPVVEIFEKTQKFLEIVNGLVSSSPAGSTPPPPPPPLMASAEISWPLASASHHYSSDGSASSISSSFPSPTSVTYSSSTPNNVLSSHHMSSSPHRITVTTPTPHPQGRLLPAETQPPIPVRGVVDLPNSLLLAICYLRLLSLYNTFFSHIHHFIIAISSPAASRAPPDQVRPPMLTPWQLGQFQPSHSGTLQMLLVTQMGCYLLAQVERALGIDVWEQSLVREEEDREEAEYNYCFPHVGRTSFSSLSSLSSSSLSPSRHHNRHNRRRSSATTTATAESRRGGRDETPTIPIIGTSGSSGSGSGSNSNGMLLSRELIEMAIRDDDNDSNSSNRELGKIGNLRKTIKRVKRLLKKTMALE